MFYADFKVKDKNLISEKFIKKAFCHKLPPINFQTSKVFRLKNST